MAPVTQSRGHLLLSHGRSEDSIADLAKCQRGCGARVGLRKREGEQTRTNATSPSPSPTPYRLLFYALSLVLFLPFFYSSLLSFLMSPLSVFSSPSAS